MDELPSAQFRKQYAKLTRETVVTVNGHPIGRWIPMGYSEEVRTGVAGTVITRDSPRRSGPAEPTLVPNAQGGYESINTRPFNPAPKPKRTR